MKHLTLILLLTLPLTAFAATAFLRGEQVTGETKQCFYEFAGRKYTTTVRAYQSCPFTIQVD